MTSGIKSRNIYAIKTGYSEHVDINLYTKSDVSSFSGSSYGSSKVLH
jgi:hypothetical protein